MLALDEQHIRETAYRLWEQDGCPIGQDYRHWEMAKKIAEAAVQPKTAPVVDIAPKKKRAAQKKKQTMQ
jgi:hypothetical protein